jgi:hypothetical protein
LDQVAYPSDGCESRDLILPYLNVGLVTYALLVTFCAIFLWLMLAGENLVDHLSGFLSGTTAQTPFYKN